VLAGCASSRSPPTDGDELATIVSPFVVVRPPPGEVGVGALPIVQPVVQPESSAAAGGRRRLEVLVESRPRSTTPRAVTSTSAGPEITGFADGEMTGPGPVVDP
jgi:hypothetical protein